MGLEIGTGPMALETAIFESPLLRWRHALGAEQAWRSTATRSLALAGAATGRFATESPAFFDPVYYWGEVALGVAHTEIGRAHV
jgi:hypothetical protein